jgi:hypothetical protein
MTLLTTTSTTLPMTIASTQLTEICNFFYECHQVWIYPVSKKIRCHWTTENFNCLLNEQGKFHLSSSGSWPKTNQLQAVHSSWRDIITNAQVRENIYLPQYTSITNLCLL